MIQIVVSFTQMMFLFFCFLLQVYTLHGSWIDSLWIFKIWVRLWMNARNTSTTLLHFLWTWTISASAQHSIANNVNVNVALVVWIFTHWIFLAVTRRIFHQNWICCVALQDRADIGFWWISANTGVCFEGGKWFFRLLSLWKSLWMCVSRVCRHDNVEK